MLESIASCISSPPVELTNPKITLRFGVYAVVKLIFVMHTCIFKCNYNVVHLSNKWITIGRRMSPPVENIGVYLGVN